MTPQTFCPNCGAVLALGAEFCGNCGTRASGSATAAGAAVGGEYAGFWIRLVAFIIDAIILMVPNGIIEVAIDSTLAQLVLRLLVSALYFVGFWVLNEGATPGKMALGLKVQRTDGGAMEAGPALLRWIGYYVSAIILLIGFIMVAFTPRKQGLHDYIAGTVVVRTRS